MHHGLRVSEGAGGEQIVIERSEHNPKRKLERWLQLTDKAREFRGASANLDMNNPRAAELLAFFGEE